MSKKTGHKTKCSYQKKLLMKDALFTDSILIFLSKELTVTIQ